MTSRVPGVPGDDPEIQIQDAGLPGHDPEVVLDTAADVAGGVADEIANLMAGYPRWAGDPSSKVRFTIEVPASLAAEAAVRIRSRLPAPWRLSGLPGDDPELGFHVALPDVESALGVPGEDPE